MGISTYKLLFSVYGEFRCVSVLTLLVFVSTCKLFLVLQQHVHLLLLSMHVATLPADRSVLKWR